MFARKGWIWMMGATSMIAACSSSGGGTGEGEQDVTAAPICADGALGSAQLQPGLAGGPDARSKVKCETGFALCKVDPRGPDADVCSNPNNCYACSKTATSGGSSPRACGAGLPGLQSGKAGGPDARSVVSCDAGYTLCKVDPHGPDNDVCSEADDCFACTK